MQEAKLLEINQNLQLQVIQNNNRSIFAKTDFKQFQTLLETEPLANSVLAQFKAKICNYCLQEKDLVRCSQCKGFYYCSGDCQKADWIVHKEECKLYTKMLSQKNLSPLKQINTQFALNLRCYLMSVRDPKFKEKLMSMVTLEHVQTPQKLQYFQEMSVVLMQNLGLQKNQQNMTNLMSVANRVSINTFTVQDPLYNYGGIAIGLFYPANFFNHNCQPNCIQVFDGRTLKILVSKEVKKGDELTISYTNSLDSLLQRQTTLRSNYLFECFCELCQVEKMLNPQVFYLLCRKCKQKSLRKHQPYSQAAQSKPPLKYVCSQCQQSIYPQQVKELRNKIKEHQKIVMESKDYATSKKSFFTIKKLLDFSDPLFAKLIRQVYHHGITQAIETKDSAQQKKLFQQAQILLKQEFSKMKTWYRMDEDQELNLLFIWKYAQMGKLAYNLHRGQKAYEYTEKAWNLANRINYKSKFKQLKQLESRYSQMKIEMSLAKTRAFQK